MRDCSDLIYGKQLAGHIQQGLDSLSKLQRPHHLCLKDLVQLFHISLHNHLSTSSPPVEAELSGYTGPTSASCALSGNNPYEHSTNP